MFFRPSRLPRLSCVCFLLLEAAMTPHKDSCLDPRPPAPTPMLPPSPVLSDALQVCHPHAAGIDIGEAEHWVAVPPGCDPQPVRRFGTFTADLDALADWLIDCGVTTVAMESTGVYWIPLFELLGGPRRAGPPDRSPPSQARPRSTRKPIGSTASGCNACTPTGCSPAAFRPDDQVCVLRSYSPPPPDAAHLRRPPYSAYAQGLSNR